MSAASDSCKKLSWNMRMDQQPGVIVSSREVGNAVMWLKYSGIIDTCDLAVNGDIDNIQPSRRMYFTDCGIAAYLAGQSVIDKSQLDGLLTETFVFSELDRLHKIKSHRDKVKRKSVCFSTLGSYELDFIVVGADNTIYGIEVKTNTGNPVSLKIFIDKGLVDKGILAKKTYGGHGEKFDTIPIFAVGARFPYYAML